MYRGTDPASEPETKNMANFLLEQSEAIIAYISYHSYGQRVFTRWDFTGTEVPEDHEQLVSATRLPDLFNPPH
jgi:hypothetical protein